MFIIAILFSLSLAALLSNFFIETRALIGEWNEVLNDDKVDALVS